MLLQDLFASARPNRVHKREKYIITEERSTLLLKIK